jgi:putative flippase GtrA
MRRFFSFALVGIIGFLIDAGVLTLVHPWIGPYYGRLLSFALAVVATWLCNRTLTFADRRGEVPLLREFGAYFVAMAAGGAVNLVVYTLLVTFVAPVAAMPVLGVAAGSLAGLAVNFVLAHFFVFRSAR